MKVKEEEQERGFFCRVSNVRPFARNENILSFDRRNMQISTRAWAKHKPSPKMSGLSPSPTPTTLNERIRVQGSSPKVECWSKCSLTLGTLTQALIK